MWPKMAKVKVTSNGDVGSRDIMAPIGHKSEALFCSYIKDAGLGASAAVKAAFRDQK